jgi:beta-lactamase regulating signal transducer with metallopeptidase domain
MMSDRLLDPQLIHVAGWTLVHFLWQAGLIGLGVGVARRLLRHHEATWRYGVACVGLFAMVVSAFVTASLLSLQENPIVPFSVSVSWVEAQLLWVCIAWCMGVAGLSLRLAGGWLLVYRLKAMADPVHQGLQDRVDAIRERLGVRQTVQVFRSALVRVPMVVGWLKPVILIPGSLVMGIPAAELEALLAHELGHIRRYDYLVNGLQTFVETVFFFHPAVWWVSKQIRLEREHCCDDLALSTADKITYTRALLELEQFKGAGLTFSYSDVRADGGHLVTRIRRLATAPESTGSPLAKFVCGLSMIAIVLTSVEMSDAGRSRMLLPALDVHPIELSARGWQEPAFDGFDTERVGPGLDRRGVNRAEKLVTRQVTTSDAAESFVSGGDTARPVASHVDLEDSPPVAQSSSGGGVWEPESLPTFLSVSKATAKPRRNDVFNRFGLGIGGGVIQSSSAGPLSPNMEVRAFWALDHLTQIEFGAGYSMFLNDNLYAYLQNDGLQVEETSNYERQFQLSLGIRRGFGDRYLSGLYYGLSGGMVRLPINRLIGDMDKSQDAYDSKTGVFFLPKVGYITRAKGLLAWDLSAGLSFSKANDVAFVQPVVSMGVNFWK